MKSGTIRIGLGTALAELLLLAFCWSCSYQGSRAQENDELDALPEPVGGFEEIQKNLSYPEFARKDGIEGKVLVEATINEAGEIIDTRIVESLCTECDREAIQAIYSVRWKAATKQGVPVASRVSIPISFRLRKMHPEND
jgi:TonB family protein